MSGITPERLAQLIEDAGTNAASLALDIGRDKDYVRDFLVRRKKSIKANDLIEIASRLNVDPITWQRRDKPLTFPTTGLEVKGKVQAGKWLDISLTQDMGEDEPQTIHVATDPRFPNMQQYALLVVGDSMNKKYEDGTYVTCVSWVDTGFSLKSGMCLHVERYEGSLTEATLKCYVERDGGRWLEPRSTNPAHKPIEVTGDEVTEIIVRGLVTGSWRPEVY